MDRYRLKRLICVQRNVVVKYGLYMFIMRNYAAAMSHKLIDLFDSNRCQ